MSLREPFGFRRVERTEVDCAVLGQRVTRKIDEVATIRQKLRPNVVEIVSCLVDFCESDWRAARRGDTVKSVPGAN